MPVGGVGHVTMARLDVLWCWSHDCRHAVEEHRWPGRPSCGVCRGTIWRLVLVWVSWPWQGWMSCGGGPMTVAVFDVLWCWSHDCRHAVEEHCWPGPPSCGVCRGTVWCLAVVLVPWLLPCCWLSDQAHWVVQSVRVRFDVCWWCWSHDCCHAVEEHRRQGRPSCGVCWGTVWCLVVVLWRWSRDCDHAIEKRCEPSPSNGASCWGKVWPLMVVWVKWLWPCHWRTPLTGPSGGAVCRGKVWHRVVVLTWRLCSSCWYC